jgi:site-specific recombinase
MLYYGWLVAIISVVAVWYQSAHYSYLFYSYLSYGYFKNIIEYHQLWSHGIHFALLLAVLGSAPAYTEPSAALQVIRG